jgi:hypothetical protein
MAAGDPLQADIAKLVIRHLAQQFFVAADTQVFPHGIEQGSCSPEHAPGKPTTRVPDEAAVLDSLLLGQGQPACRRGGHCFAEWWNREHDFILE